MEARDYFEDGVKCFSSGLYEEALDRFGRITHAETDPEGIYVDLAGAFVNESYKCLAIKLISQRQDKEAVKVLGKALERLPGNPEFEFFRGIAYNNAMNFPLAIRALEGILEKDPANPSLVTSLALSLLNIGNIDRMEEVARKVLRLNAELFHLLAIARFRMKRYSEAEDLLHRAVTEKTPFEEARLKRIAVLIMLRQHDDALREVEDILPHSADPAAYLKPVAYLRNRVGARSEHPALIELLAADPGLSPTENEIRKWSEELFYRTLTIDILALPFQGERGNLVSNDWFRGLLVSHYQKMILEGVDLPELYFRLGREFQRLNQFDQAVDYFRKCLGKAPHFLPAKISLAFAFKEHDRTEEAIRTFEELCADFRNMPGMMLQSGDTIFDEAAYKGKEAYLRAELQVLLAAAEHNLAYADVYYSIGRIHYLLEDPEQALEFFDKANLINPNFIRANIGKAVTLMQLNHADQARDILNNLSGNSTLYGKLLFNLARLYLRAGNAGRSGELLREASGLDNEYAVMAREALEQPPFR